MYGCSEETTRGSVQEPVEPVSVRSVLTDTLGLLTKFTHKIISEVFPYQYRLVAPSTFLDYERPARSGARGDLPLLQEL